MKIKEVKIRGIKSHKETSFSVENYNTLVGENNSGKSNILFALRWFFKDNVKLDKGDITKGTTVNPSVLLTFSLGVGEQPPEFVEEEYVSDSNFMIEAYLSREDVKDKPQPPKFRLVAKDKDPKELKKKFQLGDVIYIPSVRVLDDEFKSAESSTVSKLVNKFVIERVENEEGKKNAYQKIKNDIDSFSKYMGEGEDSAFGVLEKSIKKHMLDYGDVSVGFRLQSPSVGELIKNTIEPLIKSGGVELSLDSQGMGFQRSLIFSLICNLAEIKNESNKFTIYLIEEPELFLHPNHQQYFRDNLISLSKKANSQILLTSHSTYFINNIEDYSQLKRITLERSSSKLYEAKQNEVVDICNENGKLMAEAKNDARENSWDATELEKESKRIADDDELRYLLWVDPERANAFLSRRVILVEGRTEKALFSFLLRNPKGELFSHKKKNELMIVDVNGKYHIYKFAQLLHRLGIKVWVIYDTDNDKIPKNEISHLKLNEYIKNLKATGKIVDYLDIHPYLEASLNIKKENHNQDIRLYSLLNKGELNTTKGYKSIVEFTRGVLEYK